MNAIVVRTDHDSLCGELVYSKWNDYFANFLLAIDIVWRQYNDHLSTNTTNAFKKWYAELMPQSSSGVYNL